MTIKPIDRFVGALHRNSAEELMLETGKPGRMRVGGQERVLLAQEVRTDQIELLLRDALPEDCKRTFRMDGDVAFPYRAPTGPVLVRARRNGDRLAVSISHYPAQSAPPPPRVVAGTKAPNGNGNGNGNGRAAIAHIEVMPMRVPMPPIALPEPEPMLPVQSPTDMLMGSCASGETGPIELDMGTGSIPMLAAVDLQRLATDDIVGPAVPVVPAAPAMPAAPARPAVSSPPVAAVPRAPKGAIDPLLKRLVEEKGSDLHLTAGLAPMMRKDGDMGPVPGFTEPLSSATIEAWLMDIAPPKSQTRFAASSDADYGYELPGLARLRVNAFRDRRGVGGVFRVIPANVLTADQLRLPQPVRDLTTLHKGLVLVTGPTGSGKSTTLAAMIDLANKTRADHIITIEDPVEFVHAQHRCLINQREVHSDTESFSSGLRAALREDPDIILVGEMRDLETIAIAVETAETGHLVFGTLHTTTAVSTVDRIVDQFPADRQQQIRVMLSSALKGVVAQTLCKKTGGGRVAALEVLLVVPAVSNLIRDGKTFQIPSIMQTSKAMGMQTLNDALFALVQDGLIAAEEAQRAAVARAELRAMLERAGLQNK